MVEPETRHSLLLRLRDPQDQQAWTEFVSLYEPVLLRLLNHRGLQDSDARDVTQQVIVAVMRAVETWRPDGREASFRRWLFAIARKSALKFIERGHRRIDTSRRGAGGTDLLEFLNSLPEPAHRTAAEFDNEYRSQLFQRAAEQVRSEFRDSTWQAFWQTCVLQHPVADVAHDLGLSAGCVYVARSRVIARLRRHIEEFEARHDA